MALGNIFINGKAITTQEFSEKVKKEKLERITHIIESHNSMEWVTDEEFYFEDYDVAINYYNIMHMGIMDELRPINPDEILLCIHDEKTIITIDTIDKLVREGLGL